MPENVDIIFRLPRMRNPPRRSFLRLAARFQTRRNHPQKWKQISSADEQQAQMNTEAGQWISRSSQGGGSFHP
jgi:hypothetical protein